MRLTAATAEVIHEIRDDYSIGIETYCGMVLGYASAKPRAVTCFWCLSRQQGPNNWNLKVNDHRRDFSDPCKPKG